MTCVYNKRRNTGDKSQSDTIPYNTLSLIKFPIPFARPFPIPFEKTSYRFHFNSPPL
jgi:hypothetical protein